VVEQLRTQLTVRSRLALVCAAAGLCIVSLWVLAAGASAAQDQPKLTPGAVFTSTNTVPNRVLAYSRGANGQLTLVQDIRTGGNGKPAGNPPFTGFPVLDSMGSVNLSDDGDGKACLFVVNAGSNSVSSFRVRPDGLELADQKSSGGSRPASLTSNSRGGNKQVLYVLNSDNATASFRGFNVSGSCVLTQIPGSDRLLPSQASVPATIRFDERGQHLAVSERFAPAQPAGNGDIVVYPVDSNGLTGAPVVTPSPNRTPYGLDYNHHDILSVTNEHVDAPPFPSSTVSTYRQLEDGTLVHLDTEPSPGAACWNLFTNNGKFLLVTNPAGKFVPGSANVLSFSVDHEGQMTRVGQANTPFEATDNALSHDDKYLYVVSANVVTPGVDSAITAFAIDQNTGALTQIDEELILGSNSTSGLAAW
jgi:6-phosphogluconolactonase (cycloisomerase 2 family)